MRAALVLALLPLALRSATAQSVVVPADIPRLAVNWEEVVRPPGGEVDVLGSDADGVLFASDGLLSETDGGLHASTDGGRIWTRLPATPLGVPRLSRGRLLVVGGTELWMRTDGGAWGATETGGQIQAATVGADGTLYVLHEAVLRVRRPGAADWAAVDLGAGRVSAATPVLIDLPDGSVLLRSRRSGGLRRWHVETGLSTPTLPFDSNVETLDRVETGDGGNAALVAAEPGGLWRVDGAGVWTPIATESPGIVASSPAAGTWSLRAGVLRRLDGTRFVPVDTLVESSASLAIASDGALVVGTRGRTALMYPAFVPHHHVAAHGAQRWTAPGRATPLPLGVSLAFVDAAAAHGRFVYALGDGFWRFNPDGAQWTRLDTNRRASRLPGQARHLEVFTSGEAFTVHDPGGDEGGPRPGWYDPRIGAWDVDTRQRAFYGEVLPSGVLLHPSHGDPMLRCDGLFGACAPIPLLRPLGHHAGVAFAVVATPQGTYRRIHRSDDDGRTWTDTGTALPDSVTLYDGRIDAAGRVIAFVGWGGIRGETRGAVLHSDDRGQTWRVARVLPLGLDGYTGKLHLSFQPDGRLAMPLGRNQECLLVSGDGGATWAEVEPPPPGRVHGRRSLVVGADGHLYLFGSGSSGLLRADLRAAWPVDAEKAPAPAVTALRAWPSPARGTVRIDAGTLDPVEATVHDVLGRVVARLSGVGDRLAWDASLAPVGVYVVRVVGEGGRAAQTARVVVAR